MTLTTSPSWTPPAYVFLSYAHADSVLAATVVKALKENGLSVWWDGLIPAAADFDEAIEAALRASPCVLVLWTDHSVESRWVRSEARAALEAGTLLSVLVGANVRRPVEFSGVQGLDFRGGGSHLNIDEIRAVILGVQSVIHHEPFAVERPRPRRRRLLLAAVLAAVAVSLIVVLTVTRQPTVHASFISMGGVPHDVVVTTPAIWMADSKRQLVWRRDRKTGAAMSSPLLGALELAKAPNGKVAVSSSTNDTIVEVFDDRLSSKRFDTGAAVDDIALSNEVLFVVQSAAGRVTAVDLASSNIAWTAIVPRALSVVIDEAGLWVTAAPSATGVLLHLDSSDGRTIATTDAGVFPVGITTLGNKVWLADEATGTVDSYDRDLRHVATIPAGAGLVDLASDGQKIWASSSASSELVVIDPSSAKVVDRWSMDSEPFKIDGLDGLVAATSPKAGRIALVHL
jgi:DNA-binding beta-propeller fold protein YncE